MPDTTSFLIVGGGLEGLAIAYSLAERGETNVLVLERDTLCSGMTAKSSGVVRCHYGTPSLAAMSWYGIDVFTRATELFGDDMSFRQCGYVVGVAENNVKPLEANIAMMQGLGIATEFIDHDTMADLWPGLVADRGNRIDGRHSGRVLESVSAVLGGHHRRRDGAPGRYLAGVPIDHPAGPGARLGGQSRGLSHPRHVAVLKLLQHRAELGALPA